MLANPSFHGRPLQFVPTVRDELCRSYACPLQLNSRSYQYLASSILENRRKTRRRSISRSFTQFSVRASEDVSILSADSAGVEASPLSVQIPVGDRHITVETGLIGRQASGAVTVRDGETIIYTTVCLADVPSEPCDFSHFLFIIKNRGRTKDHEVLICRLIDRPLRPTMLKGFYYETQLLSWVLSYDGVHPPDALAVTAAGIAMALSEIPNSQVIAGVRVGLIDDRFIVNPTIQEMENSKLDMLLAGTKDAILMIEGYCDFLPEDKLLEAVQVGLDAVAGICKEVEALVQKCGKPKMFDAIRLPPKELYKLVEEIAGCKLMEALQIKNKIPRRKALSSLEEYVISILSDKGYISTTEAVGSTETMPDLLEEDEDEEVVVDGEVDEGDVHIKPVARKSTLPLLFSEVDVKLVFKELTSKFLRKQIVDRGKRSDGRSPQEIRSIDAQCGLLPRAHGSALFTRGETQSLAVVTLGDKQMAQKIDNLVDEDEYKRFYLQYSFPPSCVGEVGRVGAPSRREIGHGMLAERALEPILPPDDDFPYTVRVESTITESNGSSSMASVCGGCLALQDAGVPVKCSIAGIAMGMVLDTKEFGGDGTPLILSDILGSEDASGDMDFKVAGNDVGITAFQMDIKVGGITLPIMKQALLQAKYGRKHILLSKYAPLIHVMKVKPEKINLIIGAGGKKVKSIIEETGVEAIDTQDDGVVKITAKDLSSLEKSKAIISNLTMVPTIGDIYRNCEIKSIAPYGVFVEIAPGREGLCHISELSVNWLAKAEDAFKVGDRLDVKLIEINDKGQLRLSRRALLPDSETEKQSTKPRTAGLSNDNVVSVKSPNKGKPRKAVTLSKDGSALEIEDPLKEAAKRLVSPGKDGPDKSQPKVTSPTKVEMQ
ncbi:unnamed protein product [Withania somnifera]